MKLLLPTVWLPDEVITAVLGMRVAHHPNVQLVGPTMLAFCSSSSHSEPPTPASIHVRGGVDTILFPALIDNCHWVGIRRKIAPYNMDWLTNIVQLGGFIPKFQLHNV